MALAETNTSQSQKLLWSAGAGGKRQLDHFWHFNIETATSATTAKMKPEM